MTGSTNTPASRNIHLLIEGSGVARWPKVEIEIDLKGTAFEPAEFPANSPGTILQLSGPPGGPLGMQIKGTTQDIRTNADLKKFVESHSGNKPGFKAGTFETIHLGEKKYLAMTYIGGESQAQAAGCTLIYAPSTSDQTEPTDKSKWNGTVLINFELGSKTILSCQKFVEHNHFAPILKTMKIQLK